MTGVVGRAVDGTGAGVGGRAVVGANVCPGGRGVVGTLVVGRVGAAVVHGSKFVPEGMCGMHQEGSGVAGVAG